MVNGIKGEAGKDGVGEDKLFVTLITPASWNGNGRISRSDFVWHLKADI